MGYAEESAEAALPALDGRVTVGRDKDLAKVQKALTEHRIVTVTGQVGGGKTRLVKDLAWKHRREREHFDCELWCGLEHVSVGDNEAVIAELAYIVGARANASLEQTETTQAGATDLPGPAAETKLAIKQLITELSTLGDCLLVLDNCEHVLDGVSAITKKLLDEIPGLRVLATSQKPLNIDGEKIYSLPGLPIPDPADPQAAHSPAVQLLVNRIREHDVSFDPAPHLPDLVRLVERLGASPLALRNAARHVAASSPVDVLEQIHQPEALLRLGGGDRSTHERHIRMEEAARWMWQLADPAVQTAWVRLAELPGSVERDVAVAVVADHSGTPDGLHPLDVPEVLTVMVESSILELRRVSGYARYTMPGLLRAWAQRQIAQREEGAVVRRRALHAYAAIAEEASTRWFSADELRWLVRWRHERPNLNWVIDHAVETDPAVGLRIMIGCVASRGGIYEGRIGGSAQQFRRLLEQMPADSDPQLMAVGFGMRGWLQCLIGDREGAAESIDEARRYETIAGVGLPEVALTSGIQRWWSGAADAQEVLAQLRSAIDGFGNDRPAMRHLGRLYASLCAAFSGLAVADELAERVVLESGNIGKWAQSWAGYALMVARLRRAQRSKGAARERLLQQAQGHAEAAARLWQAVSDRFSPLWALLALAWIAAEQRRPRMTAMLLGAAARVERLTDERITELVGPKEATAHAETYAREAIGDCEFDEMFRKGLESNERVALDLALAGGELGGSETRHPEQHPLSPRLWRVVSFLQYRSQITDDPAVPTNSEIAEWAHYAKRTVEGYLQEAYEELEINGPDKREQLAYLVRDYYEQRGEEPSLRPTVDELTYAAG